LRPTAVDDSGFLVQKNGDGSFSCADSQVLSLGIARQTLRMQKQLVIWPIDLAQLGVEKELFKQGAVAGSEVRIGSGDKRSCL
jgi:GTPase